jgi:hypothetical protein
VPPSARESVAGIALGIAVNAFVIGLGLLVPLDHAQRDRVDNALVSLGVIGVLLALLLPPSGMMGRGPTPRLALAAYAVLSLIAVLIGDFGARAQVGWAVRISAAVLTGLSLRRLARGD